MEPNPYEGPKECSKHQPLRGWHLGVPWFWLALLLLAIAVMIVNQIGVMRATTSH